MGKSYDDSVFGWDNEYGTRTVEVAPFRASKFLVSNGEFFEFVKANAYNKREYWSDEGYAYFHLVGCFITGASPLGIVKYELLSTKPWFSSLNKTKLLFSSRP